jgi:hypothetical protein
MQLALLCVISSLFYRLLADYPLEVAQTSPYGSDAAHRRAGS